ncbi:lysylphosphatidylglycerol synthase transmembrane domain-containing protein [Arundinibacter roseus]|uniref:Flippase-like domain-containing protein n=1 Tax=Arundinibacter roseus TaxID=2070510 RepID=A0A4R4K963_9BACT|nr:lysylphosphatidylglycerol synthase transmembrane domain-containing protein [Arundinibacter roseus]TDB63993.1 flippase-like domain-containing protein [Arundinibacter roseus]
MKNALRYVISLGLAGALLWYVFKDIDLSAMMERLAQADWSWVALSCGLVLLAHLTRAWRWQMLMEPLGYKPTLANTLLSVLTGYFANYIVPRMGEVTRCGTLYRLEKVPVNQSFGTVVAERVFDVLTLLLLIMLNFFLEFDRLSQFFLDFFGSKLSGTPGAETSSTSTLLIILGVVFLVLIAAAWWVWKNESLREKILKNALVGKIVDFLKGMADGLLTIRRLRSPGLFILSTLMIWVFYFLISYVLFFCIPETSSLGLLAGLTLLVIGAIGMTAPTQGGIGAYHLLVGNVMILYGLTQKDGITLATFVHGTQMVFMLVVGAISFLIVLLKNKSTEESAVKEQVTH